MSSAPPAEQLADGKLLIDQPARGVVRLTISNPAKRNALDHPILDAITRDARAAGAPDAGARCVIVTGAHGMFSAGYDIGEIPEEEFEERAEALVAHPFTEAIDALEAFPYPTLAVIPGHTSAAGSSSRWPATCASRQDGIKLGMPRRSSGSSTRTPACAASSTRSAPRARASCSYSAAHDARDRLRLGSSTASRPRTSSTPRSSWPASWPATPRSRRPATSA